LPRLQAWKCRRVAPPLPALGAAQALDGLAGVLPVGAAALRALLLGQRRSLVLDGHHGPPGSWPAPGRRVPIPDLHAPEGCDRQEGSIRARGLRCVLLRGISVIPAVGNCGRVQGVDRDRCPRESMGRRRPAARTEARPARFAFPPASLARRRASPTRARCTCGASRTRTVWARACRGGR